MLTAALSPSRLRAAAAAVALALSAAPALAADPPAADVPAAPRGLAVHLGATDGALEADLAADGTRLVQGLTTDPKAAGAARRTIAGKGLYGLATVEVAGDFKSLPYAGNLVNVLVADLDALGPAAPPEGEILRVLVPGTGVARLRRAGVWGALSKPRPAAMDEWTHFDYGPEGNGVSHDRLVKPPTFLQWVDDVQTITLGGNPAGYHPFTSIRCQDGRAYFEWSTGMEAGTREKEKAQFYTARDAFNGLPLWDLRNTTGAERKEMQFVAAAGKLFAFVDKKGPLVALDGATGKVVRAYDRAGPLTDDVRRTTVRYADGTLVESSGGTLYALDAGTGALRWKFTADDADVLFPVVAAKEGKVFATIADAPTRGSSRWPAAKTRAVVCLDLAGGRELWRNTDVNGSYVGQLVHTPGSLALFASAAIGGGENEKESFVGDIDPADGKLLWHTSFKRSWNSAGYNMLVRDGSVYYADAWHIRALDLKGGREAMAFDDGGYNQRCNRFSATDDYFMFGLVTWVDRDARGDVVSITRSGCAQGAVPANGMVYFTPNACQCLAQVRGFVALSAEPPREPTPDERRLEKDLPPADPSPPPAGPAPAGPIAADWAHEQRFDGAETRPVEAEGRQYVAVTHQHRLECREGGRVVWAYTAGGRISSPPVLQDGLCFFGSHDGYVYCLEAKDGRPRWRFLAAAYPRQMMAWGQLASSWPVFGVVVHDGALCASAGLHPEVGGGIRVWGLSPRDGAILWKKTLSRSGVEIASNPRRQIHPNRVLNDVLTSDGQALSLPGIRFTPAESDAEIAQDLAGKDEPKKKK